MKSLGKRPDSWDGHLLLLYQAESQRREGVVMWVRCGLKQGSKILFTVPRAEADEGSLLGLLRDEPNAREALDHGQIQLLHADERAYDPAWQAGVVEEALDQGYPSVRWSGGASTAWSLMSRTLHETIERATDELCRTHPVSVMCQYALPESFERLGRVSAMHRGGVRERLFRATPSEDGLAVAGEIDRSNHDIWHALLTAATSRTERPEFVIDLTDLDFVDAQAVRSLLSGTARFRELGGRVRLQAPQPHVDSPMRLLRVDRTRSVVMEGT